MMMIGRVIRRRMSSRHVAVVGSVCVDSFIGVPRLPSSGETLVCRRVVLFFSPRYSTFSHFNPQLEQVRPSRHWICLQSSIPLQKTILCSELSLGV